MSAIPDDIRKKAEYLCGFLEAMPSDGNVAAIAEALMERDERALKIALAEQDHCISIAADRAGQPSKAIWLSCAATAEGIAVRIRSPDTTETPT